MIPRPFDADQARLEAAHGLPLMLFDEFQRLTKSLLHGPAFQLLLLDCSQDTTRNDISRRLERLLSTMQIPCARVRLNARIADAAALEHRLGRLLQTAQSVQILGAASWFTPGRWDDLNQRRERLSQTGLRLMLWLDPPSIAQMTKHAPDLWSWRAGVYAFTNNAVSATTPPASPAFRTLPWDSNISMVQRHRRIAELREMMAEPGQPGDELRAPLLDELSQLLAETGQLDEALRIRQEQELPIYERLGDAHAMALTMGSIADILQARGQFDEALRIREQEELPVYERLGDVRSKAVTMGQIADILHARGRFDEALRIRQEEQLPVYERMGDERSKAITMGQIADIMQARGQLDEALRIRREQELPVYERLHDMRFKAITMGKIAGILQIRGQLDEAVRIRQQEQLPVYERLGDAHALAVGQAHLAMALHKRGRPGDLQEARALLLAADATARRLDIAQAQAISDMLRKLPTA